MSKTKLGFPQDYLPLKESDSMNDCDMTPRLGCVDLGWTVTNETKDHKRKIYPLYDLPIRRVEGYASIDNFFKFKIYNKDIPLCSIFPSLCYIPHTNLPIRL